MDRFTIENEGTYTVQIQDGKAKSQSSLVLIGDGMLPCTFYMSTRETSKTVFWAGEKQTYFISLFLQY
jgi:hypothetical protein